MRMEVRAVLCRPFFNDMTADHGRDVQTTYVKVRLPGGVYAN
jgi:hypothetical protein